MHLIPRIAGVLTRPFGIDGIPLDSCLAPAQSLTSRTQRTGSRFETDDSKFQQHDGDIGHAMSCDRDAQCSCGVVGSEVLRRQGLEAGATENNRICRVFIPHGDDENNNYYPSFPVLYPGTGPVHSRCGNMFIAVQEQKGTITGPPSPQHDRATPIKHFTLA